MNRIFQRLRRESVQPPWDNWDIDEAFLQSLCRYSSEHSSIDNRLDNILNAIITGLEESKDLFELIPENPFPARGLLIAVGCLIKLGITVHRTKANAHEFARQVTNGLEQVKSEFEADQSGNHFNRTTWRNLRKARDIINEICLWGYARIEDQRWSQIENGLTIGKEIDDFKVCLSESTDLIKDLFVIRASGAARNLANGMRTIRVTITSIFQRQDELLKEIRKVRRHQRDQLAYVISEMDANKQAEARRVFLEQKLDPFVVANPTYNKQRKYPCDKDTRVEELSHIKNWLYSNTAGSQNFLWLTGDPGCGKSTLTASLAEHCLNQPNRVFFGQFFIDRSKEETTDPNAYFPSIIRQLANQCPEVELALQAKLKQQPGLAIRMSSDQATDLFISVLTVAAKIDESKIVAVVIDGLDETEKTYLHDTATILSRLFDVLTRYPNIKVFISSRMDEDIRNPFSSKLKDTNVKRIHLDTASSVKDVASFLRKQMREIVDRYDLDWEEFPGEERMTTLEESSRGLFVWAVTAANYIRERIGDDGRECLGDVLNELTGEALDGVNSLYTLILSSTHMKKHVKDWEFEKFRRIVGAIIALKEPLCVDDLAALLNLRYTPTNSPADIVHFVRRMRTVLVPGTDAIDGKTIPQMQRSFVDFITDVELFKRLARENRLDSRLCIDRSVAEAELGLCCLQLFASASGSETQSTPGSLRYASRFFFSHAEAVVGGTTGLVLRDPTMNKDSIQKLLSTVRCGDFPIPRFSGDFSGPPYFFPSTTAYQMATDVNWTKRLLSEAPSWIHCLAFSQNGEQLISGSKNGLIIVWDMQSGKELGTYKGHTETVMTLAFSNHGDKIVSGSQDCTVRLWDSQSLQEEYVLHGHSGCVRTVTFAPQGSIVASGSDDKTIRLWDTSSGDSMATPFQHEDPVHSLTFTPDGKQVISGTSGGLVHIWDRHTGQRQQRLMSPISRIQSVVISPRGDRLVAIGNGDLCFWSRTTEYFVLNDNLPFDLGRGPNHYFHLHFSPDEKSIMLWQKRDDSSCLFVHDLHSRLNTPLLSVPTISSFALSPDCSSVAFNSNKKIHIWKRPHLTLSALSPNGDIVIRAFSDGTVWSGVPKDLPVVKNQLKGKVDNLKLVTFSSDSSLLAAVDRDTLYLWDISTLELRARGALGNLASTTSLFFLPDQQTIVSTHENDSVHTWSVADGTLLYSTDTSSPTDVTFELPLFLDVDEDKEPCTVAGAQWFPSTKKESGVWAYVDGNLIKLRADSTVTVLPFNVAS